MRCPLEFDRSAELIVGYGARTLDPAAAAAFERHIVSCAECRAAAALQKAVWAALDESQERISPDFDRRVFERIAAAERRGRWLWQVLVPAAASMALAAVLFLRQPDPAGPPPVQMEQVEHALDDMDLLKQLGAAI
jgi:hypothetical protein